MEASSISRESCVTPAYDASALEIDRLEQIEHVKREHKAIETHFVFTLLVTALTKFFPQSRYGFRLIKQLQNFPADAN
ncbi:MAG: hypothetical protein KF851_17185 [Pirellulaceae bacterium]|nr:hypothetical protein [Pirellulaceae bacterium]